MKPNKFLYFFIIKIFIKTFIKPRFEMLSNLDIALPSPLPVSVIPTINTLEYSSDSMTLIKSFLSSFGINKVNPFSALLCCLFFTG